MKGHIKFLEASTKSMALHYNILDGTCVRDYIHVCDLADAHVLG